MFAWTALVATGCSISNSAQPPERSLDVLHAAATSVVLGGTTLRLEAVAWRSYQPITGDAGDPLIAIVRLRAQDGGAIAKETTMDVAYLVRGTEIVGLRSREEQPRGASPDVVEWMVRDGPHWTPGDSIDVIAAVRNGDAAPVLVRAPRIVLSRVS